MKINIDAKILEKEIQKVKALKATLYEKIMPSAEKVEGFNKYTVEVVG